MTVNTCTCNYCQRNPSAIDRVGDKLVSETAQREFIGGVSHMWLRRRAADPEFCFPVTIYIGRRPFRWLSDIAAWVGSPHARLRSTRQFSDAAE